MSHHCKTCSAPADTTYANEPACAKCAARLGEYDHWSLESQADRIIWNASQHDPFWRAWLLSAELFETYKKNTPIKGLWLQSIMGGDLFEFGRDTSCWVQIWMAPRALIVAYPPIGDRYEINEPSEGIHELPMWIDHLRHAPNLELGQVRGRCSYGAYSVPEHPLPIVKWAQVGDWAALARNWFVEMSGSPANLP